MTAAQKSTQNPQDRTPVGRPRGTRKERRVGDHNEFATELNVELRFVPTVETAPMMMTATRAAIRPYSMAVTPDSSR
jgi:hypothetical protein